MAIKVFWLKYQDDGFLDLTENKVYTVFDNKILFKRGFFGKKETIKSSHNILAFLCDIGRKYFLAMIERSCRLEPIIQYQGFGEYSTPSEAVINKAEKNIVEYREVKTKGIRCEFCKAPFEVKPTEVKSGSSILCLYCGNVTLIF